MLTKLIKAKKLGECADDICFYVVCPQRSTNTEDHIFNAKNNQDEKKNVRAEDCLKYIFTKCGTE